MTAVVALSGITRQFPGNPPVDAVRSCNVEVQAGDFLTIVGPSGSGKSTLLNVVGLLDRPTSGRYELLGRDVATLDEVGRSAIRAQHVAFVFQSFQLLEYRSSVENVMMASLYRRTTATAAYEASMSALSAVGMKEKADVLPVRLSGGERQRVAIARAISGRPSLLLADEPTGNLDTGNAASILELFAELNRAGTTIALITHDPNIASVGNRTLSILDGVVTERATR